jgi:hypothetical protein
MRIAVAVTGLPAPGGTCAVVGATASLLGRKAVVDCAAYAADGGCLCTARAPWIAVNR